MSSASGSPMLLVKNADSWAPSELSGALDWIPQQQTLRPESVREREAEIGRNQH